MFDIPTNHPAHSVTEPAHTPVPAGSGSAGIAAQAAAVAPPSKHQLALMIWLAVFPTLTVLNLTLKPWLVTMGPVVRTLVLATIAVPIVIYGLMPRLHRLRARILTRRQAARAA